uniref:Uncharacterized protein n=1 Tax=Trypanosoma congolense (strain IL3000) TaxID=1068625 RepID=G0V0G0_TRYCI|nr:conserved hypothetical protein [Trypanosoma congolense IL3000]
MNPAGSGVSAVYALAEEAQNAGAKAKPVPAFELYKGAREEELCCYRSMCRVLSMHSGGKLTKQQKRILEDMREELCVTEERAEAELAAAQEDILVKSVAASGVLKRRESFFDGVADVSLEAINTVEAAADDQGSLYIPQVKAARTEQMVGGVHARRVAQQKVSNQILLKNVERIGYDIKIASNKLLSSVSTVDQQACRQVLQQKRQQLLTMLKEFESSNIDISNGGSALPSEQVY